MRVPARQFVSSVVVLAFIAGCSSSSDSNTSTGGCLSTVNSAGVTSPSQGQLVVPGTLYSNESLTIGYTLLGHLTSATGIAPGNPSASITFLGLPSGTQTFTFQTNCTGPAPTYTALHGNFPSATVTIK